MQLLLPPALTTLLDQHPDTVAPEAMLGDGWLTAVTGRITGLLEQAEPHLLAAGSRAVPGHTMLLLADLTGTHPAIYLRLPDGTPAAFHTAAHTSITLPLTGTLNLALYRDGTDVGNAQPQYLRALRPGQVVVVHAGATVGLSGGLDTAQIVLTHHPLAPAEYQVAAKEARARLADPTPAEQATGCVWPAGGVTGGWLGDVPDLRTVDLATFHAQADVLDHLAGDRNLLTYLATSAIYDPERFAASRTTLLLDRIVLCAAEDRGFEIRLNTNPHPGNQRLPHDHAYSFTARVLTGGYLHVVHRRTNGRDSGPFASCDITPAVTTTEVPGSSYTLAPTLVHQALILPDTTTLMLRGPYTSTACAADDLIPPVSTWPAPIDSAPPVHSRAMTDDEHLALQRDLVAAGVIDG